MIKKIQKYLLLHKPMLWNIRIVPMLLILLVLNIIFFGLGYISTDVSFSSSYYYYSPARDMGLLYFFSILTGILLLIGWLIFYNRNNAFKTLYPTKTSKLYVEWLLIFVISSGITLIPYFMTEGYHFKWQSVASQQESKKALEILEKAELLIPDLYQYNNSLYSYNPQLESPIPIPDYMTLRPDSIDLNLYSIHYNDWDKVVIEGYTGPSLLFYKTTDYYYENYKNNNWDYLDTDELRKIKRREQVKGWLINGQTDSILTVMKDFVELQKKHGLHVNLTPERWLERIYNPPFFPIDESNTIVRRDNSNYSYNSEPYLPFDELNSGYTYTHRFYKEKYEHRNSFILVSLCIAMMVSMLIFSFRATSGKPWLIAFIAAGVLMFIIVLSGVALGESMDWRNEEIIFIFISLSWIALFIVFLSKVLTKIRRKDNKGKSNIYINIMIWLTPCIIPLLYFTYILHCELVDNYVDISSDNVSAMFWISLTAMIPAMWLIALLVRNWKSIAEE